MELDPNEEDQALLDLVWHGIQWNRTLSGVELSIPDAGLVDQVGRWGTLLLLVLPLLTPLWVWLDWMSWLGVLWLALLLVVLLLSMAANRTTLAVVLSPQSISTPAWSVPFEDIDAIMVARSWWQCQLAIVPRGDTVRYIEVAGPRVARKLSALIERHADRRRVALQREGHNVHQAARPPKALAEIVRTKP